MRPVAPTSGASARSPESGRQVTGTRVSLGSEDGVSPPLRLREPKPHPVAHARGPRLCAPRSQRRSRGRSMRRDGRERRSGKLRLQKRHDKRETEAQASEGRLRQREAGM